ncbi:pyridoxal-phosphate dependent enzyme [Chryseolinea sp. T2]|uniref:1-aminocyclopropane-1-carboxylate deaminase/D-cysteine desulfhydrase n=1 Tax=Chryseolinea sp. T2 TaxID=3129255 RepID=UPI003076C25C
MTELSYHDTPIVPIGDKIAAAAGVSLQVKREDLNHPYVSGNKWWKLKLNIARALEEGHDSVLTFGGAHSNHIYATAAAARSMSLKCIGVIRGEEPAILSSTLSFARKAGMKLEFVSRADYKEKNSDAFFVRLREAYGKFYLIPEGGSNELGVAGVAEFSALLPNEFDYICCPIGTGATMAGLIRGSAGRGFVVGFPVLKGGDSWRHEVAQFEPGFNNWDIISDYHFGGYGKSNDELEKFMKAFTLAHNVPVEHVYSGKMFYGILDMICKGYFKKESRILAIHTGGIR